MIFTRKNDKLLTTPAFLAKISIRRYFYKMLKYNDLRAFLAKNSDPAKFNLLCILDSLSLYLDSHITLIDNTGSILYGKRHIENAKNTLQPLYTTNIPLSIKSPNDAILKIQKKKLSQTERVIIEMVSGLISVRMH